MPLDTEQALCIAHYVDSRKHAVCRIEDTHGGALEQTLIQTLVLGADLEHGLVLLSDIPVQATVSNDDKKTALLRLRYDSEFLFLRLSLLELSAGLSTWMVTSQYWSTDKRWLARACFTAHRAPKVLLTREYHPNIEAELKDINSEGACVLIWNKNLSKEFHCSQSVAPEIRFNDYFRFRTECRVLQSSFQRQPCGHTRLRLKFAQLDEVTRSQIQIFMADMMSPTLVA